MSKTLLYFTSRDCSPCKVMLPITKVLCSEANVPINEIDVSTVNGRTESERWGIFSVPTLILIDNDNEKNSPRYMVGSQPNHKLKEFIEQE